MAFSTIAAVLHPFESVKFNYFGFHQPKKHVLNFKYIDTVMKCP